MDEHRFDTLTRGLASSISRRGGLRLLASAGASLLALARGKHDAAAQEWFLSAGEPCRTSDQCRGADAPLICGDNGFDNDGQLNCCTFEGSRCGADAHCCGLNVCFDGFCRALAGGSNIDYTGGSITVAPGDPCQTTSQCNRSQTGAICEYTVSTGDNRCCWYEGSLCSFGAQCCGSRVCAGGVCQALAGGSGVSSCSPERYGCNFPGDCCGDLVCADGVCRALAGGSNESSGACTWEGCACELYRDPECRASCQLYDPCDPGLVCTGTSEDIGTCVPDSGMDSGCTGPWCPCSWTPSFDPCDRSQGLICCSYAGSNQGLCLPMNEYCGGGVDPGDECASFCGSGNCPICASGYCTDGGYCA